MLPDMLLAMLHRAPSTPPPTPRTTADAGRDLYFPGRWFGERRRTTGAAEPGYFTGATTHGPAQHS